MTKYTPLDIIRSLSCGMDDGDCVAIIEFCVGILHKPSSVFKAEKIVVAAAELERTPIL